jgi:hypothetical protein
VLGIQEKKAKGVIDDCNDTLLMFSNTTHMKKLVVVPLSFYVPYFCRMRPNLLQVLYFVVTVAQLAA